MKSKNRKMKRLAVLCTVFLLAFGVTAKADESETPSGENLVQEENATTSQEEVGVWPVEIDRTDCSISLTLQYRDENNNTKQVNGGSLALYKLAGVKEDNGYVYDLSMGRFAEVEEAQSIPGMRTSDLTANNSILAFTLNMTVEDMKMEPDATVQISAGRASFNGLTPGLYLVSQKVASDNNIQINAFLVSIPSADGSYNVDASPKPGFIVVPNPPGQSLPETTPEDTTTTEPDIPVTGQDWWPAWFMLGVGVFLFLVGLITKIRSSR